MFLPPHFNLYQGNQIHNSWHSFHASIDSLMTTIPHDLTSSNHILVIEVTRSTSPLTSHLFEISVVATRVPGDQRDVLVEWRAEEVEPRLGEDARVEQAQRGLRAHVHLVVPGGRVVKPHHGVMTVCGGGRQPQHRKGTEQTAETK